MTETTTTVPVPKETYIDKNVSASVTTTPLLVISLSAVPALHAALTERMVEYKLAAT